MWKTMNSHKNSREKLKCFKKLPNLRRTHVFRDLVKSRVNRQGQPPEQLKENL